MGTKQTRGRPARRTRVKLPDPPPKKEAPVEVPPPNVDFATLGTQTTTRVKEQLVQVGKTDLGKAEMTMKTVPVTITSVTPNLTLEEAKLLGPQPWAEFPPYPGQYFCKAHGRRFLVTTAIYKELVKEGLVGEQG